MKLRWSSLPGLLAGLGLLSGCAASSPTAPETDPWEGTNRAVNSFNTTVDRYTLKPIAKGYQAVLPEFMRIGVSNFSRNLYAPASSLNNLLQGKPGEALSELGRFVINTTVGVAGLVDVATPVGLERNTEDFGQTLAVWGVPEGPFVIVPLLGPYTLRDAAAFPVNIYTDALRYVPRSSVRDKLWALRFIDIRYRLLPTDAFLAEARDPYVTLRESYLQNRRFQVFDGNPPVDADPYGDLDDDLDDLDDLDDFDDLED